MGPDFLNTLDDDGANAPPAWVWVTRLFLGHVTASETTLTLVGLFDGLLFLAMAWRWRGRSASCRCWWR